MRWILRLLCLLLVGGTASAALAQTGKLSGRITDTAGEPIPGATVLVTGTTLGAASDVNGDYVLLRVPPGTYTVRFSSIGYQTQLIEGVRVTSNNTTTLDAQLGEEVVEGEEVVVIAERPIVDVSLTSTMATLSREDIAVLPVQQLDDIVNLQAGVVDGHFRGGREGEVQYQVDGVSVNNPYDNKSTLRLDRSVLQEVQVIQGTFDAEFGQAMSGVVNAVLRSGDADRYEFSAEVLAGDYVSPGNDSTDVRSFFGPTRTVALYPHIGGVDPTTLQNVQASLSGPVPVLRNTTFLLNGQRYANEGYLVGVRRFMPTDTSDFENRIAYPTGDNAVVPLGFNRQWSWLGKVTNRSFGNIELSYQAIANQIASKDYKHEYRYNPEATATRRTFSIVHGVDWTHTLSALTFYELSLRQNYFDYKDLRYEDVRDPRYFEAGEPRGDANYEEGAVIQGVDLGRFVQRTNAFVAKGAVTSQATKIHLVKAGFEFQAADVDFGAPGKIEPRVIDGIVQLGVVEDTLDAQVVTYNPLQAAFFVQDRVEWRDLRIRGGVRVEYFDANATVPSDLANPANAIAGAPESRPKATTAKVSVAPRLGISFPIHDRASMFFSYGHFYQMPGFREAFANADYSVLRDLQAGAVSYGVLGNPDLKPEFTAQYEFGFKAQVADFLGLDANLFYKDIRDLLGVEFVQTYTAAEYARLTNVDFGDVRGFTLALDQRGPGRLSSSLDYTLQVAAGNASDPKETATRASAGGDPRPRQAPLNWDQRHTLNGSVVWYDPGNLALTAIVRLASGQPYTPSISSGFGAELETNSGRKPNYFTVDLRAEKFFRVGGLDWTGFVRVFNLFDEHFVNGTVYADTGSPFYTLNPDAQRNPDPKRLGAPRRIEVGLSLRGLMQR